MLRKQLARTEECAEVNIISSEDRDVLGDGKKIVNGATWHTDDSFMREPCSLTMLYGVVVPSRGGDTQFTNMHAAYDDLPPETKARIDGLRVIPDGVRWELDALPLRNPDRLDVEWDSRSPRSAEK